MTQLFGNLISALVRQHDFAVPQRREDADDAIRRHDLQDLRARIGAYPGAWAINDKLEARAQSLRLG